MINLGQLNFSSNDLNAIGAAVLKERERRKFRRLSNFVRTAWPIVEGSTPYSHNWHIDMVCEHLEAVFRKEIRNLLMNVPPGSMKSIMTSVMFPAWMWKENPETRVLSASYGEPLSVRDAVRSRHIIESEWFQSFWGEEVQIARGQNQKTKYANTRDGWRIATSVGGRGTGEHPDVKLVDDPHNVKQAESDAERQTALDWFDQTLSPRGESRDAGTVVTMQRLHAKDLSGHIMEKSEFKHDWEHILLPMEFEPGRMRPTRLANGTDPRTKRDEPLWPALFTPEKVIKMKRQLGEYGTAGQLQQRPAPIGGGIIKTDKFKLWPHDKEIPAMEYVVQSYDTAHKEQTINDPSACTAWGVFYTASGAKAALLLDAWSERMAYPKLRKKVIEDWSIRYTSDNKGRRGRRPDNIIVEEKSSGIVLIQDLNNANIPAFGYNPGRSDKVARVAQATPLLDAGCFYVIESTQEPGKPITWARPFIAQCGNFPNDEHDDYVDTWSQAALWLRDNGWLDLDIFEDEEEEDADADYSSKNTKNPYDP